MAHGEGRFGTAVKLQTEEFYTILILKAIIDVIKFNIEEELLERFAFDRERHIQFIKGISNGLFIGCNYSKLNFDFSSRECNPYCTQCYGTGVKIPKLAGPDSIFL